MTTTHSVEPLRRPLRVWPGVVTAIAVVALRFGLPLVWSDGAGIGILAGVAGAAIIVMWWLFFSHSCLVRCSA